MKYANYVAQVDESDCGVAALAMILKNFGSIYPLAKLRDLAQTTSQGTTALGLVKAANRLGLKVDAVSADIAFLKSGQAHLPLIAHVVKNNLLHYCVVYKVDSDYVYVADPDPTVKVKKMTFAAFSKEWSGVCLMFATLKSYTPQDKKLDGLLVSFKKLGAYKGIIFKIIVSSLFITLIGIIGSYYLQVLIDTFIPTKNFSLLDIVTIGLLLVYVVNAVFNYVKTFFLTKLDQKLSAQIGLDYIQHVYHLPMRFFSTRKTGEITSRFSDINKIIDALSSTVISIFLDAGMMVIIGLFLFRSSRTLFLITMLALPLFAVVIYCFNRRFAKLDEEQMESNAIVSSSIIEDLRGIETVKVLQVEKTRYQRVAKQFGDFLGKNLAFAKVQSFQESLKLMLQSALTTIVLFEGAQLVVSGRMSLGALMAYNTLLAFFISPLQNIVSLQIKLQEARVANNRLNEVLAIDAEPVDEKPTSENVLAGEIQLKDLSYSYGYGQPTLQHLNLTIPDHAKLAIVGLSGSGKSTLAKIIEGFYHPTSGQVLFNHHDVNTLSPHSIRRYVYYLPQSAHLFSGTIKDNLLLGLNRQVSHEQVVRACQAALIYDDIKKLPLGFETVLDEESRTLSGGQVQRLTIARALLSDAHVLIFDESTSNLDPLTEKRVVDNILKIKDKTIIFIAHRLSIAKKVNNIVVLLNGRIVEQGSHRELIANKKYYYDLFTA